VLTGSRPLLGAHRLITDWPAKKRQAAAGTLTALIDAIQRDLTDEDQAAEHSADDTATAAAG